MVAARKACDGMADCANNCLSKHSPLPEDLLGLSFCEHRAEHGKLPARLSLCWGGQGNATAPKVQDPGRRLRVS